MQLACKSCEKTIPAEDINIDKAIAKCGGCHAVFSFLDNVRSQPVVRPLVAMPKGFVVDNWGPELSITRRWYSHGLWFLLLFCILWDGFLVVWYSIAIAGVMRGEGGGMWIMLVFPVLHLAVGIGLTYGTLCGFLNKTWIRVSMGELSVRHGPLPTGGNRQLLTIDVKQLFCTEKVHRGKHGLHYSYAVQAQRRDGTKVKLLSSLQELDQALFVEQQIEQHLRIADERVPGEVAV